MTLRNLVTLPGVDTGSKGDDIEDTEKADKTARSAVQRRLLGST
ncbi:hypothetical protein GGQ17_003187 [Salinibacter ruber]|nr:hypothetical protein [Salinibacter ruber]